MQVKNRNTEQQRLKDQRVQEKQLEEKMLAERNQNMKNQIKDGIQMTKEMQLTKAQEEAERLKLEKREQREFLNMQKQQEYLKNANMKQMIKIQEQEVEEKRRKDIADKKARNRLELQQKIIAENQRRMHIESEVSKMEQEELELIQRLQNTQLLQKQAYEDLETAIQNPNDMSQSQREFSPLKGVRPQTSGGSSAAKNWAKKVNELKHSLKK